MVGKLLLRGMLVGVLAGLLSFVFLKVVGEPAVDRAIAFETQMDEAKDKAAMPGMSMPGKEAQEQEELVSRPVQAGIGLFTGVMVYSAAFGGLFALVFALVYGRLGNLGARAVSALLAVMGFVSVYLVPNLKYPANPPAVGEPETIGMRTALYFAIIAISLAVMIASTMLRRRLLSRFGIWDSALIAGAAYIVVMIIVSLLLPTVNEVPEQFPAVVLWQFRIASITAQLLMWSTIGLAFGKVAETILPAERSSRGEAVRA
jgi:predicted cobalt transporter CbtA